MRKSWDLRERTMEFAVEGFKFCRTIRSTDESRDILRQLRRALSAVAANYRATRRSQSDPAFVAKLAIVIEEADEASFWFDFLVRLDMVKRTAVEPLAREATELVAIFTKAKMTMEARIEQAKQERRKARKASRTKTSDRTHATE
jgi:four helix bundle protein